MRLIAVGLSVYIKWSEVENNLRPALTAAVRTYLQVWVCMADANLAEDTGALTTLARIHAMLSSVGFDWMQKFLPYYTTENAFASGMPDSIFVNEHVFEQIGILGMQGLLWSYLAPTSELPCDVARQMGTTMVALVRSHTISKTPAYDQQAIDIALGMLLLVRLDMKSEATESLVELIHGVSFARRLGRFAPCSSDSFEDVIALRLSKELSVEKMTSSSILIPVLAHCCAMLDSADGYSTLVNQLVPLFPGCTLQVWHPDSDYERLLAGDPHLPWGQGVAEAPYNLPQSLDQFRVDRKARPDGAPTKDDFKFTAAGLPWLPLVASRSLRGPIPLWFFDGANHVA